MSTYTDLRNRVKENITVGYAPDDRTTLQKVKFHNEENEYWGTFTGKVSVDDITVDGGALNDVSVYNGYIKNTTLVNADGTKVNLSEIGDQITELSTETIPDLVERISSLESRSGDMPGIMNDIKGLKADMTAISSAISAETKDRIASDESVSSFLSTEFDKKIDDKLAVEAGRITREISDREAADAQLSNSLACELRKYADDGRHYNIRTLNVGVGMPFKAEEFAVNVITSYDMPDAFVRGADKAGDMVGLVERFDLETGSCEFVPFQDCDKKYASILGSQAFKFAGAGSVRDCRDPMYKIQYAINDDPTTALGNTFIVYAPDVGVRNLYVNGSIVGIITNASDTPVISGFVKITAAGNPVLSVFADGVAHRFDNTTDDGLSIRFDQENAMIVFQPELNRFSLLTGLNTRLYYGLSCNDTEWGRIYQDTSPDESNFQVSFVPISSGFANEQNFALSGKNAKAYVLQKTDADGSVVRHAVEFTSSRHVRYYNEKIRYGYGICVNEKSGAISVGEYNKTLDDSPSCIYVNLSALDHYGTLANTLKFDLSTDGRYWYDGIANGRRLVAFIGKDGVSHFSISAGNVSTGIDPYIDLTARKVEDKSETFFESQEIDDFSTLEYDGKVRVASATSYARWDGLDSGNKPSYTLECSKSYRRYINGKAVDCGLDDIAIMVPDKPEGSAISREFLFVVKPLGRGANIRFVGENGEELSWFANKKPEFKILPDTFITFRLQEVRDSRFMVVDWNINKQQSEIDALSSKLSTLSGQVLSNDSDINEISSVVSALLLRDRKDLSYMGEFDYDGGEFRDLSNYFGRQTVLRNTVSVQQGWTYRASVSMRNDFVDGEHVVGRICENDYVIFKNDVAVSCVCWSDINFIRDAQVEVERLSSEVISWTHGNFAHLSGGDLISGCVEFIGKVAGAELCVKYASADYAVVNNVSAASLTGCAIHGNTVDADAVFVRSISSNTLATHGISVEVSATIADLAVETANVMTSASVEFAVVNDAVATSLSTGEISACCISAGCLSSSAADIREMRSARISSRAIDVDISASAASAYVKSLNVSESAMIESGSIVNAQIENLSSCHISAEDISCCRVNSVSANMQQISSASVSSDFLHVVSAGNINAISASALSVGLSAFIESEIVNGASICSISSNAVNANSISSVQANIGSAIIDNVNGNAVTAKIADIQVSAGAACMSATQLSSDYALLKALNVTGTAVSDGVSARSISAHVVSAESLSVSECAITLAGKTISVGLELNRLDSRIDSNAKSIDGLSVRYANTFSSNEHVDRNGNKDLSADNLRLFDEFTYAGEDGHREYRMILSAGTIVLKKVN